VLIPSFCEMETESSAPLRRLELGVAVRPRKPERVLLRQLKVRVNLFRDFQILYRFSRLRFYVDLSPFWSCCFASRFFLHEHGWHWAAGVLHVTGWFCQGCVRLVARDVSQHPGGGGVMEQCGTFYALIAVKK
jgi:hypothetical protein